MINSEIENDPGRPTILFSDDGNLMVRDRFYFHSEIGRVIQ